MRRKGTITTWKDDQGFGFITPAGGGTQVFVHIKSFANRTRRPTGNEFVSYELTSDDRGRMRAERVEFIGGNSTVPFQAGMSLFALPVLFLMFVAVSVLLDQLPFAVLALYLVASVVLFLIYAHDKSAAGKGQWRTPESTLHVLSVLGGWPGAFIAQRVRNHKLKKQSFQIVFWATVLLNWIGLVWLFSASGAEALRSFLDRFAL